MFWKTTGSEKKKGSRAATVRIELSLQNNTPKRATCPEKDKAASERQPLTRSGHAMSSASDKAGARGRQRHAKVTGDRLSGTGQKELFVHHENHAAGRACVLQFCESVRSSVEGKPPNMWTDAVGGG
jgi:hypothetical protein